MVQYTSPLRATHLTQCVQEVGARDSGFQKTDNLDNQRHHPSPGRPSNCNGRPHKRSRLAYGTVMDSFVGDSSSNIPQGFDTARTGHPSSNVGSASEENLGIGRFGDILRRGNSDGAVLSPGTGRYGYGDGETWMDFLRYSGSGQDQQEHALFANRRAAMMAADRHRRIAAYAQDVRRRSSSNSTFPSGRRTRPGLPPTHLAPAAPVPRIRPGTPGGRTVHKSTSRRPSTGLQFGRSQGQEIILPRWQPDNAVTKCPICNTTFSFWYRKHHCRKCGRVVCANCSPHRITIPRQFIVHPPDDSSSTEQHRTQGIEVVDLTSDDEASASPAHSPLETGHDRGIDASLGGGQEVRLCNPCVPDPNPLPHVGHASPRYDLDTVRRPEFNTLNASPLPPRISSHQRPLPPPPRRESLGRQSGAGMILPGSNSRNGRPNLGANIEPDFDLHHQRSGEFQSLPAEGSQNHLAGYGSMPGSSLQNVRTP